VGVLIAPENPGWKCAACVRRELRFTMGFGDIVFGWDGIRSEAILSRIGRQCGDQDQQGSDSFHDGDIGIF
jgi:hypothetical protein